MASGEAVAKLARDFGDLDHRRISRQPLLNSTRQRPVFQNVLKGTLSFRVHLWIRLLIQMSPQFLQTAGTCSRVAEQSQEFRIVDRGEFRLVD